MMTTNDWLQIAGYAIYIITVALLLPLLNKWVGQKKTDSKRAFVRDAVKDACNYYETTEMNGSNKNDAVVADVTKALQAKGYNVDDATVQYIKHYIETCVNDIRLNDAQIKASQAVASGNTPLTPNADQGNAKPVENAEDATVTTPED